ncbi:MAG: radical SAM protein [Deltaproteobacteria bacterium]|nr:radical SAM protein [Deltaproteobacteria bacterium]
MFSRIATFSINALSSVLKPDKILYRPLHFQLEPTTYCNLRCPQCPRDSYVEEPRNMTLEEFAGVVDLMRPTHITLSGLGEPTLNPELFDMISYARKRRVNVNTTSNFVVLTDRHVRGFLRSDLNLLTVSVDAATPGSYLKVRGKDCFSAVIENVRILVGRKKEDRRGNPSLRLAFVVQKENLEEISDFYRLAADLGVDAVLYQVFSDSALDSKKRLISGMDIHGLESRMAEVMALEKKGGRPITNAGYLKRKISTIREIYSGRPINLVKGCIKPWVSAYITVEGDVRPCCSFGAKRLNMGNVFETGDVGTIFNHRAYRDFREKIKRGKMPDAICSRCIPESPMDILERSKWTPNFIASRRDRNRIKAPRPGVR